MTAHDVLTPYFLREVPSSEVYQTRLQDEFHLVDKFGFTAVFVQVHAILDIARRLSIPHIIRGSAGSSLLCFLMGITEIDPILYGLQLARFMNEGRQDLPDVDCSSVFAYTAVEGKGLYEKRGLVETIQIETIHGISLQSLRTIPS
jgi:hypothetical protein